MGPPSIYLDTNVVVPLIIVEPHSPLVLRSVEMLDDDLVVSDLMRLEFASAVARKHRMGELTAGMALKAVDQCDAWVARFAMIESLTPSDLTAATSLICDHLGSGLRGPDALHLALAQRLGATLLTGDQTMADAAALIGLPVVVLPKKQP